MKGFTEEAAKSWISGERNCQTSRYFPEGRIKNELAVFKYFRNRSANSLKVLRDTFRQVNGDGIIKCDIDNDDTFCWSILNQFLALLGFPLSEEPVWETDTPVERASETMVSDTSNNERSEDKSFLFDSKSKKIIRMFKQAVIDYKFKDLIDFEPTMSSDADALMLGVDKEWVDSMDKFIFTIEEDILYPIGRDQAGIYSEVTKFVFSLEYFISYLKSSMTPSDNKTWIPNGKYLSGDFLSDLKSYVTLSDNKKWIPNGKYSLWDFHMLTMKRQDVKTQYEKIIQYVRALYISAE